MKNKFEMYFDSISENESFARVAVAAFITRLDPTLEEISDIKTAVSEAVTNAIIHGYDGKSGNQVFLSCEMEDKKIRIVVRDQGIGIEDVEKAKEPMYTTKPEMERSGMGFVFMEVFMDRLEVNSRPGCGTEVIMEKEIGKVPFDAEEEEEQIVAAKQR